MSSRQARYFRECLIKLITQVRSFIPDEEWSKGSSTDPSAPSLMHIIINMCIQLTQKQLYQIMTLIQEQKKEVPSLSIPLVLRCFHNLLPSYCDIIRIAQEESTWEDLDGYLMDRLSSTNSSLWALNLHVEAGIEDKELGRKMNDLQKMIDQEIKIASGEK